MKLTAAEHRALEQVEQVGRRGLLVDMGWESVTQMKLVERGLLWQEYGDQNHWKFTVSPAGCAALRSGGAR